MPHRPQTKIRIPIRLKSLAQSYVVDHCKALFHRTMIKIRMPFLSRQVLLPHRAISNNNSNIIHRHLVNQIVLNCDQKRQPMVLLYINNRRPLRFLLLDPIILSHTNRIATNEKMKNKMWEQIMKVNHPSLTRREAALLELITTVSRGSHLVSDLDRYDLKKYTTHSSSSTIGSSAAEVISKSMVLSSSNDCFSIDQFLRCYFFFIEKSMSKNDGRASITSLNLRSTSSKLSDSTQSIMW